MAFQNPITGGEGALIYPRIKSPDYDPGVAGWSIERDGSAEFNDVVMRGELEVGTAPDSRIRIETGVDGGIIIFVPPDDVVSWVQGFMEAQATGSRPSIRVVSPRQTGYTNGQAVITWQGRSDADTVSRIQYFADSHEFFGEGVSDLAVTAGDVILSSTNALVIGTRDQGRGVVTNGWTTITAVTAASAAEAVGITSGSISFRDGRAYAITVKGLVRSSVAANCVEVRVRKGTTIAGQELVRTRDIFCQAALRSSPIYFRTVIANTTGATISTQICGTYENSVGAGNAQLVAVAAEAFYLLVEDVGVAGDYPNARLIT